MDVSVSVKRFESSASKISPPLKLDLCNRRFCQVSLMVDLVDECVWIEVIPVKIENQMMIPRKLEPCR